MKMKDKFSVVDEGEEELETDWTVCIIDIL